MVEGIRIKDIDNEDRPREKLLKHGASTLSDKELLAILFRTGTKSLNVVDLSDKILKEMGGIKNLKHTTYNELKKFKGVGQVKAVDVLAAIEFARRLYSEEIVNIKCDSPKSVAHHFRYELVNLKQEVFWVLDLDTKGRVLAKREVFKGGLFQSDIHPREIFKDSLRNSAASVICLHNHPSGDPTPSLADLKATKTLQECGELLGIELLDHLVIAKEGYVSISGLMGELKNDNIEINKLTNRQLEYIVGEKKVIKGY